MEKIKFIPYPILFIPFLMQGVDKFLASTDLQLFKTDKIRNYKLSFLHQSFSVAIN